MRVDEAVRGVWRRFRGCLCCWIVVQSGPFPGASRGTNQKYNHEWKQYKPRGCVLVVPCAPVARGATSVSRIPCSVSVVSATPRPGAASTTASGSGEIFILTSSQISFIIHPVLDLF